MFLHVWEGWGWPAGTHPPTTPSSRCVVERLGSIVHVHTPLPPAQVTCDFLPPPGVTGFQADVECVGNSQPSLHHPFRIASGSLNGVPQTYLVPRGARGTHDQCPPATWQRTRGEAKQGAGSSCDPAATRRAQGLGARCSRTARERDCDGRGGGGDTGSWVMVRRCCHPKNPRLNNDVTVMGGKRGAGSLGHVAATLEPWNTGACTRCVGPLTKGRHTGPRWQKSQWQCKRAVRHASYHPEFFFFCQVTRRERGGRRRRRDQLMLFTPPWPVFGHENAGGPSVTPPHRSTDTYPASDAPWVRGPPLCHE